ncbi:carboxypeptidase regulatory-like domain-containing protein [Paenibacillus polymyxa]|uniref:Uncharacterized protein n=1 Tax=Paenibacillus polymyxa TaxID=1406 RepID=A0A378Y5K5_PAEPO|nr:carboxypeptidase-like regulatory domain-containing protein [Paenibacillus polymyxa]MBE7898975.1 carboxypeptidase regulatory-like domain-containing protein [Paenibacillus polymyxa]MBG9763713.1 hypothetical protein [Paenibacillus polymyxa]MCC3259784.1 carboxypeptidase-like regulatory domain-containing protein [Paenibacillus polymyxa]QPK53166.1 carboxypeptidase regulatory-like domain-containing protein [Paenibacillus polymyxa]QPK58246.1 carboxypeptidase regulatory-like domain-containing protei
MLRKTIRLLSILVLTIGWFSASSNLALAGSSQAKPIQLPTQFLNYIVKKGSNTLLSDLHTTPIRSKSLSITKEDIILKSPKLNTLPDTSSNNKFSVSAVTYDVYNTTPDGAIFIKSGNSSQGYITAEGESRWFFTRVETPNKLTVFLNPGASTTTDYDLHLYKLDESTGTLNKVSYSTKGAGQYEQASYVAGTGYYFILVQSYKGFNITQPFTVHSIQSDSYDSSEPDDNPWFAKDRGSATFSSSQTIDNILDEDWSKINVPSDSTVRLNLNNTSAYGEYRLDLYDANLTSLGYLSQNTTAQIKLSAGEYYIRVIAPSKFDLTTPYTLTVSYQNADVARVITSNITTDGGVYGFMNYGYGQKWRIKNNITISGRAFDAQGSPVANAIVTTRIIVTINNKVFTASGTTNEQGYFTIPVSGLTSAAGKYSFYNGVSTHYFDIIPIDFYSGGKLLNSDINSLYHFAYQIR